MENIIVSIMFLPIIVGMFAYAYQFRKCLNTTLKVDGPEFDSHSAHALLMQRAILYRMNANKEDAGKTIEFVQGWQRRIEEYINQYTDNQNTSASKDSSKNDNKDLH